MTMGMLPEFFLGNRSQKPQFQLDIPFLFEAHAALAPKKHIKICKSYTSLEERIFRLELWLAVDRYLPQVGDDIPRNGPFSWT